MRRKIILFIAGACICIFSCKTAEDQVRDSDNPKIQRIQKEFLGEEADQQVVFRIFASSENYIIKQLSNEDKIKIGADSSGELAFAQDLSKFDVIDLFAVAVYSVELYSDSGKIAKIRPVRPAKVSELNRIIADDITRLRFEFKGDRVEPAKFYIEYGILLQKKISSEEQKKLLKENAR